METTATSVPYCPRFRSTLRLVQWVRRGRIKSRLPADSERCFLRGKESPEKISKNITSYAHHVGEVGPELEALILAEDLPNYIRLIHNRGVKASEALMSRLKDEELVWAATFYSRIPESLERRIKSPSLMQDYAQKVGPLAEHLEEVILDCPDSTMNYVKLLKNNSREITEKFLRVMVGHDRHFVSLAQTIGRRLPEYLEESISDPEVALNYARYIVRDRLPESIEQVLQKSARVAVRYAFEVVRGFASVRLPEAVHSAVLMKSFENPNDGDIRRYIQEVDRIPEKPSVAG